MVAGDPEGALVYEDESWFVGKAYGGRCWGQRGRPTWIPAFGPTQGEALYLSLDLCSTELLWRYVQKTNAVATTQWLTDLAEAYPAKRYIVVVWDNASWHKAAAVQLWLGQYNAAARREGRPVIFLFPLPTYSPWLNPVEAIFNQTKRRVLFGRNFADPVERRRTLDTHFAQRNARAKHAHNSMSFESKH